MKKKPDIANEAVELMRVIASYLDGRGVGYHGITILAYATGLILSTPFNAHGKEYDKMSKMYRDVLEEAHQNIKRAGKEMLKGLN